MTRIKSLFAAAVLAATVAVVPAASAQTVHFLGSGSSAMFQGLEVAAVNDLGQAVVTANPGSTLHHWSVKTSHSGGCGGACAGIIDSRSANIPEEFGNLWVAWVTNSSSVTTDIWADVSVDSTVGVRTFLGGAKLFLGANIGTTSPDNAVSPTLLVNGGDDATLAADVITALGGSGSGATGAAITAGLTDIRPEDALYATMRSLNHITIGATQTSDTSATGTCTGGAPCRDFALNYQSAHTNIGSGIKSGITGSTAAATPVLFALPGFNDPFTSTTVSNNIKVFPVGESPIVFIVNRGTGLGVLASDGTYYAKNLWDQHPFPANGNPPAPTTRRPLGNLFTGHDCQTENAVFQPTDTGASAAPPGGTKAVHLFLREPLSGTMNTTEYTEFRIYGTTNGNGPTGNGQPALTSQEQNVIITGTSGGAAPVNPLTAMKCVDGTGHSSTEGDRTRGIGTGEVTNGVGANGGVLNTSDSLTYTFFSFSNVSKMATKDTNPLQYQPKYGYLTIDGIDPIFDKYDASGASNPGQPAEQQAGVKTAQGELPACSEVAGSLLPHCTETGIWGAGNPSYPHVRDGSYPAWSELRMMCDTSSAHCLDNNSGGDTLGAEALVRNLQNDIHTNKTGGVPDYVVMTDDPAGFNPPYGEVGFIREHYQFKAINNSSLNPAPTSTHQSAPQLDFHLEACSGGAAPGTPDTNSGGPTTECGGDAGGLIKAVTSANPTGVLQ